MLPRGSVAAGAPADTSGAPWLVGQCPALPVVNLIAAVNEIPWCPWPEMTRDSNE